MKNNPTFTVVVPVYNVEKWIEECLKSILAQTFKDFELLVIDDCGTDNSIPIAESFAQKDKRIKIIKHEKNKGLGGARNTGIEYSNGKYIVFVDSDDWVEANQLSVLYEKFEYSKSDCLIFDAWEYFDETKKRNDKSILNTQEGYLTIDETNINCFSDYAWVKAYTKESIVKTNITFPEKLTFEDGEFYFKYFSINHNVYCIQQCLYNYRVREGSIVTNKNKGIIKLDDIYQVIKNVKNFYVERGIYEQYKMALLKLVSSRINTCRCIPNHYKESLLLSKQILEEFNFPNEFVDLEEKTPLVSIVVPFYNVEKYIEECLTSILGQTYTNLEILCVDDCGQDNSINIVKKYAKLDKRIKIIRQTKNKGLGGARNTGLKKATGKYIFFVDSDDWLDNSCISTVVEKMQYTKLNTVWFKANIWWEDIQKMTDMWIFPTYASFPEGQLNLNDNNLTNFPLYTWNKGYDREFLISNNLYWRENKYFEDVEFYFKTFTASPDIYIIDKPLYYYRRRNDSIISTSTKELNIAKDLYFVTTEVYKFLKENNLFSIYKNAFMKYVLDTLNMYKNFSEVNEKLLSTKQQYLKAINFPNDYISKEDAN